MFMYKVHNIKKIISTTWILSFYKHIRLQPKSTLTYRASFVLLTHSVVEHFVADAKVGGNYIEKKGHYFKCVAHTELHNNMWPDLVSILRPNVKNITHHVLFDIHKQ